MRRKVGFVRNISRWRYKHGGVMKIGDVIEYLGPLTWRRPKYGMVVHLKKISSGHEVGIYFPNNSYVQVHSKYVGVVCK